MSPPESDAAPAVLARPSEPVSATEASLGQVQQLAKLVTETLQGQGAQPRFSLLGPNHEALPVPKDVLALLQQLLAVLASGDAVSIVPVHKELTTQQAANLLNVSRQYLVQLLDEGKIPYHRTGTHRRVLTQDVLAYRTKRDAERDATLAAMIRETQESGGYPEFNE
ncbi:helix-turn-helix domain-containing protein [Pyxidicoccus parkwayensis]|jgi:excisionase family DNA binding protein|uniref:Helix-turn-helix domain-containing protein n=1 Tax=Pyxidicoccus parkwayensis TaxID=2813578 RepID=A0ABX7NQV7_9BACT|nr:helix-turn-helix domain-containing protein [Pyxidicoccus parkwaysis]QSQ21254.1 helix-turn-helix domain-containing protein [Pyxidicoccus parkwaysis]